MEPLPFHPLLAIMKQGGIFMEYISVQKKKSHRTGIRWFGLSGIVLAGILMGMAQSWLLRLLILILVGIPLLFLYINFESWSIRFSKDKITFLHWGKAQCCRWADIQEVTSLRSATEGETICIRFRDGTVFRFRREDENGEKAVKQILKHTSIRSK